MKTKPLQTKLLVVEGNIGAGKSTMLNLLKKNLNASIIHEPADKWQKVSEAGNLLDLFYKDTPRWAYTFQSYAFLTRVQSILDHQKTHSHHDVHILERSVYCDRFCFAKNAYEAGNMTPLEWQIYTEWFAWLVEHYAPKPSGFIYLKTDPKISYARLVKRNRHEESTVPLEYLTLLNQKHDDWLVHKKEIPTNLASIPVLVLECNQDFEQDLDQQQKHFGDIQNFVASLS